MHLHLLTAIFAQTTFRSVRRYIYRLGGLGFIPLGLLDASIIPIPGSMDVLTIILSSRNEELWLYYAMMATVGSVLGGFATYRLARKGGKEMLAKKFPRKPLKRAYAVFEKWGFASIAIPAMLPPPMPMVPFVLAAGAMQYSTQKFLAALTLGRIVRFTLLAYLAARYGRGMMTYVTQHGHPVLVTVIGLAVTATAIYFLVSKAKRQAGARA
jgi:membrane protein YqaA with SNARE-associated domain